MKLKTDSIRSLREAIQAWVKKEHHIDTYDAHRLRCRWPHIAGKSVARRTQKIFVRDQVLYVYVNSGVLRHGLQSSQQPLIARINQAIGRPFIKRMVLR